ncbi:methylation-associated defense system protein kinase MAD6 [Thiothrix lacustris]|uniref:methylation-associated defense system protein kinase MAD6 n=1 Tax=Thiothrix lacustris TaxID=525917 RepID=UPI0027E3CC93|nr:protein kinase [Thiothrix lacustris]WMP19482.1 protein kinase [Thiothrix lacustris]
MAKVIAIGQPANEEERKAIAWLRDHLPDDYYVVHNFEVEQFGEPFEVDVCIITPHALYVVDVKGVHGRVDVNGNDWQPASRAPYKSPLPKLRGNAKALSSQITRQNPRNHDLKNIYVDAAVLLSVEDCDFHDPDNRERGQVIHLKDSTRFFTDASRIPQRFTTHVLRYYKIISEALGESVKKPQHGLRLGNWEMAETLQVKESFKEYRGFNPALGLKAGTVRVRAYQADPYQAQEQREKQVRLLQNAYRALYKLPAHSAIVNAKDFFTTETADQFILITEDIPSETLANHIHDPKLALTLDQKKRVVRDILGALAHCHQHEVVHRNLNPQNILMGLDGQPRLTDFDYAKIGKEQTTTIADQIQQRLESRYKAPELWADDNAASPASDVYSFALVIYELFTGQEAFASATQAIERSGQFAKPVSQFNSQLPAGFDTWLDQLKLTDVLQRLSASAARVAFDALWQPQQAAVAVVKAPKVDVRPPDINYQRLPSGFLLAGKFMVQKPLGKPGGFGIVYKAIDTLGDVPRAIKLILQDRESVLERLKQEYRTLLKLPEHPYVVRVFDASVLPNDGPPYIVFEYLEGHDVSELMQANSLTLHEVWQMGKQVAEGLEHLHENNVYHCDIKPQNLIWQNGKVKIIDFNVSVEAQDLSHGGGSQKYLPPDLDVINPPQTTDLIDRDLYALGITLYRAITGEYPWANAQVPPPNQTARNPNEFARCVDLHDSVSAVLLKLIAPKRADRFASADMLLAALNKISQLRKPLPKVDDSTSQFHLPPLADGSLPGQSAFHDYLLTLYSQSRHSNSGTRGLDDYARLIYVDTRLDTQLMPTVLAGALRLVIITGNAGDGKTAFLQQLEAEVQSRGVKVRLNPEGNGCHFELDGQRFVSNYDGSQDEGGKTNEQVLLDFLQPYTGVDASQWPQHETRLIAINEGRLVDFLSAHRADFPCLQQVIEQGLQQGKVQLQVAVVNLNLRNVLTGEAGESIFERLLLRMVDHKVWQGCDHCGIRDKCYVRFNVATFQDQQVGNKVVQRLKHLYELAHLRNQLHITLRDLRSALAYMLVGEYSCSEIRDLYQRGDTGKILQGYYFNAWRGKDDNQDRLLHLLQDVDVAFGSSARLDRGLDFLGIRAVDWLSFENRGTYDEELLNRRHTALPSDTRLSNRAERYREHQHFVGMLRRKAWFEARGEEQRQDLSVYRSAKDLLSLLRGTTDLDQAKQRMIHAMNRGEGLYDPDRFQGQLAMQVRRVDKGTIRSFRLFPADVFSMKVLDAAMQATYVEHEPSSLVLEYTGHGGMQATLSLDLDLFEMLQRLYEGYVPGVEELQGYYLSLTVFKHVLASAPYQEVLLTTDGRRYQKISRSEAGSLSLATSEEVSV